jgi:predicted metal-dependent phosphoesterase TrpH
MIIDMHIHTERYSHCAHMSPDAMARAAVARGLDGVVITEHDVLWSEPERQALQARHPDLTILRGIEVTTHAGHALVYGVTREVTAAFHDPMPLKTLTRRVHAVGGVVFLAHPARYNDRIPRAVYHAGLDGLEVRSYNIRRYMERPIEGLQADLGLPGIAGTDAHTTDVVGLYATDFAGPVQSEDDLVAALKGRAFSLTSDTARIRAFNAGVADPRERMLHLNGASPHP